MTTTNTPTATHDVKTHHLSAHCAYLSVRVSRVSVLHTSTLSAVNLQQHRREKPHVSNGPPLPTLLGEQHLHCRPTSPETAAGDLERTRSQQNTEHMIAPDKYR